MAFKLDFKRKRTSKIKRKVMRVSVENHTNFIWLLSSQYKEAIGE
jgi:hypothetical protein